MRGVGEGGPEGLPCSQLSRIAGAHGLPADAPRPAAGTGHCSLAVLRFVFIHRK